MQRNIGNIGYSWAIVQGWNPGIVGHNFSRLFQEFAGDGGLIQFFKIVKTIQAILPIVGLKSISIQCLILSNCNDVLTRQRTFLLRIQCIVVAISDDGVVAFKKLIQPFNLEDDNWNL
jgi:hypothetical protein